MSTRTAMFHSSHLLRTTNLSVSLCLFSMTALLPAPSHSVARVWKGNLQARKAAQPKTTPNPPKPTGDALLNALENEDVAAALVLVMRGADPNVVNENRTETALTLAATLGDLKLVRALLDKGAAVNPTTLDDVASPLECALLYGHREIAELLTEKGANVNVGGGDGIRSRPLVQAAAQGWETLVVSLLDKGAEINHAGEDKVTALMAAATNGHLPVMQRLVDRGARVEGDPLLVLGAVSSGSVPVVEFLLARGRRLTEKPDGEQTFLHAAAQSGSAQMLALTLQIPGADIESKNKNGETPLMVAARAHEAGAVTFLASQKARVDAVSPAYRTALDIALDERFATDDPGEAPRRAATVAALRKAGAKPAPPSVWKAALDGSLPKLKAELDDGADPNVPDAYGAVPLYYALQNTSSEGLPLIVALLAKGANPNARTPDGRLIIEIAREEGGVDDVVAALRRAGAETPELDLTEAVERGDEATLTRLLDKGVIPDADALVAALDKKDAHALLKRLLDKKAKVNAPTRSRDALSFVLHTAVALGDVEAVRLLLDYGADPNQRQGEDGPTAIMEVISENTTVADALARLLIERGADVRARKYKMSVLTTLAGVVSPEMLSLLLDKGAAADINSAPKDTINLPPLFASVRAGKLENVRLLLDRGADPNARSDWDEMTPLMELAMGTGDAVQAAMGPPGSNPQPTKTQYVAIAKLLIERGALIDAKDESGRNALRLAQDNDNEQIAQLIRAAGGAKATIDKPLEMGRAIADSDIETVERLLKGGFDVNGRIVGGSETPLSWASSFGDEDIVTLLLARGADINGNGKQGTPLHSAAGSKNPAIVRLLLARGANPDTDGILGPPLAAAAGNGEVEIMRLLLKAGADPNAKASQRPGAPLVAAISRGGPDAVEFLLKAGADPNIGDALQTTLWIGGAERLARLVRAGGRINTQNEQGRTLLMDAAANGQKEIVAWLIAHKADLNLKDKRGRTALSDALERDQTETARLLRKAGAKTE